ncbi:MAG: DUF3078 domain-containing protein [Bacteroidia bacterium]|nr:DUF3078 domain-containing protein [Bacteroidia bacterium]
MKKTIILISLLALSVVVANSQDNKIVKDVSVAASSNQAVFVQQESTTMSRRDSMKQSLNAISDKILDQMDAANAGVVLTRTADGSFLFSPVEQKPAPAPEPATAPIKKWKMGTDLALQVTQNFVSSNTNWSSAWYSGGNSNFAGLADLKGWINYDYNNLTWDNFLELEYGLSTTFKDDKVGRQFHMTDDLSKLTSKLGYKAYGKWYYSAQAEFSTTLFDTYPIDQNYMSSSLASPIRFYLSLGMDYKWSSQKSDAKVSLFISPIAYKMVYVNDMRTFTKILGDGTTEPTSISKEVGLLINQQIMNDAGALVQCNYIQQFNSSISLESKLSLYTNYLGLGNSHHTVGLEVDWEITANFVLYKILTARVSIHPRYDSTTEDGWDKAKLQLKEFVSLGLAYTFKNY